MISCSIKLAGSNQQNQIGPIGIFSIHFVLNCTISDTFIVCDFEKNHDVADLRQDQLKIKRKKKKNIRDQYD